MGADLLVYHASILTKKTPDRKKGEARIKELAKTPLDNWPKEYWDAVGEREATDPLAEKEDLKKEKKERTEQIFQLKKDLDFFAKTIDHNSRIGSREITWLYVGPYTVWLTGGMSWGDPPTDAWYMFERLDKSGILDAMGFNQDTNAVKLSV